MKPIHVRTKNTEERRELIEFLETHGYRLDPKEFRSKEDILNGSLPISVDLNGGKYNMMGNVTCAAAAAASGVLKTLEEFYSLIPEES